MHEESRGRAETSAAADPEKSQASGHRSTAPPLHRSTAPPLHRSTAPPLLGDSHAATLQKVLTEELLRLRRLNASIPRDWETICPKCLEKALVGRPAGKHFGAGLFPEQFDHCPVHDEERAARASSSGPTTARRAIPGGDRLSDGWASRG